MNRKEFLSRFDFEGYIRSRFSLVIDTSVEDRVRVCCPMCGETSGHLYVLLSQGLPYCQRCKYDPKSPVKFIADVEGVSFADVYAMCGDQFVGEGVVVEELVEELFEEEEEGYFEYEVMEFGESMFPVWKKSSSLIASAAIAKGKNYLLERGVSVEQMEEYGIRYCYSGSYSGRIIVPCFYKGDLVTFVARDVFGKSSRKYLNPIGNKQSDFLFNYDRVGSDTVVLTEGVFDAISASAVLPAVASFGKSLSQRQIGLLNRFKNVIFYWDKDAYPQAEKYAKILQSSCGVVIHSDGKDAGSRTEAENRALLSQISTFDSVDYEMFKLLELNA